MTKPPSVEHATSSEIRGEAKSLLKSLFEGLRTLVVIDEKLAALGKEGELARRELQTALNNLHRLIGKVDEMEKRFIERLSDFEKRLSDIDKLIDYKVELSIHKQLEHQNSASAIRAGGQKPPKGRGPNQKSANSNG
jgi:hypothetical protein